VLESTRGGYPRDSLDSMDRVENRDCSNSVEKGIIGGSLITRYLRARFARN
jgi:hypothetical protein